MLPTYLVMAWFALPFLTAGALLVVRRNIHLVLVAVLGIVSIIAGTAILANYVWAVDAQLLAEIDKYEPGTPEAERASDEWASDTDRSFLLIASPVLTAIWYGGVFLLLFGLRWVIRQAFPVKATLVPAEAHAAPNTQPTNTANPYQSPPTG